MIIPVNASKPYNVVITSDFSRLNAEIKKVFSGRKIAVLTDDNTYPLFFKKVEENLKDFEAVSITVKHGEKSKNIETYAEVLSELAKNGFKRNDCLLTLGGGVVGDLGGFVASTYMRGITYIQCPTTLLACVDSSVGGKTAIDLKDGKNLVGTFYQPSLVYANVTCLKTLPEEEIACGMGEVVKYALLSKDMKPQYIKERDFEKIIEVSVKIKSEIVSKDEFDRGVRATLNLGHTVGHAVENLSGYTLFHGVCVAKGINLIIDLSADFYGLTEEKRAEMKSVLSLYPFDLDIPYSFKEIGEKLLLDKKADQSGVNFVLLKGVGKPTVEKLDKEKISRIFH